MFLVYFFYVVNSLLFLIFLHQSNMTSKYVPDISHWHKDLWSILVESCGWSVLDNFPNHTCLVNAPHSSKIRIMFEIYEFKWVLMGYMILNSLYWENAPFNPRIIFCRWPNRCSYWWITCLVNEGIIFWWTI